jgi:hypothetical protein
VTFEEAFEEGLRGIREAFEEVFEKQLEECSRRI